MKTGSHWAGRREGGVRMYESTERSKGLLFRIYDFIYNYKSYITLLCWPPSVCPPDLFTILLHECLWSWFTWTPHWGPLNSGFWLNLADGRHQKETQRMVGSEVRDLFPISLPDGGLVPQLLSDGPSTQLSLQFFSSSLPCPFTCGM